MREILFKNLTSAASRKKDILLKEIFEKDGVVAKTERRCFYFIKNVKPLLEGESTKKWMDPQGENSNMNKRHFHIFKEHNDTIGADKIICKIIGVFYAIADGKVFTIAFLHSFKATFAKATLA